MIQDQAALLFRRIFHSVPFVFFSFAHIPVEFPVKPAYYSAYNDYCCNDKNSINDFGFITIACCNVNNIFNTKHGNKLCGQRKHNLPQAFADNKGRGYFK